VITTAETVGGTAGDAACYISAMGAGADIDQRFELVLENADRFFMKTGNVHQAAVALARRLDEAGIPYAVAGALALAVHGFERFTTDVDLVLTREGLSRLKAEWLGRGYVETFPGSRGLRDTEHNISVDVLIAGDFPGDGLPKPVAFPDPAHTAVEGERYKILALPTLVEMKLASGMTAPHRLKDLADVIELIRAVRLPETLADSLNPYVRAKYLELWRAAQGTDPL
jgi:hypothetical protein